jgi:hypothetical protein
LVRKGGWVAISDKKPRHVRSPQCNLTFFTYGSEGHMLDRRIYDDDRHAQFITSHAGNTGRRLEMEFRTVIPATETRWNSDSNA